MEQEWRWQREQDERKSDEQTVKMRAKEDAKKIEKLKTELNDLKSELKRLRDEKRTMNILGKQLRLQESAGRGESRARPPRVEQLLVAR